MFSEKNHGVVFDRPVGFLPADFKGVGAAVTDLCLSAIVHIGSDGYFGAEGGVGR